MDPHNNHSVFRLHTVSPIHIVKIQNFVFDYSTEDKGSLRFSKASFLYSMHSGGKSADGETVPTRVRAVRRADARRMEVEVVRGSRSNRGERHRN